MDTVFKILMRGLIQFIYLLSFTHRMLYLQSMNTNITLIIWNQRCGTHICLNIGLILQRSHIAKCLDTYVRPSTKYKPRNRDRDNSTRVLSYRCLCLDATPWEKNKSNIGYYMQAMQYLLLYQLMRGPGRTQISYSYSSCVLLCIDVMCYIFI